VNSMLAFYAILMVVVGIFGGIGWAIANTRSMPDREIRAVVGPIQQAYAVDPATLCTALGQQIGRVRGASVARTTPTSLDVNVRPSLSRTDDAMGLFVHIDVYERPGGGAICSMHGEPKTALAVKDSSASALRGFDRELRMTLKRDKGIRIIEIDGASTPHVGSHVVAQPTVPAPSPGAAAVPASPAWWN